MKRTRLAWAAVTLLALSGLSGCETAGPSGPRVERIVLVTVDGLVPAHTLPRGGKLSVPGFEALYAESHSWVDAWTATPVSRPAVTTYLTGLTPDRHGVYSDVFGAPSGMTPTLPRMLGNAGWATAAFVQSGFIGRNSGLLEDFADVDDPRPPLGVHRRWVPSTRPSELVVKNLSGWLDSVEPGKPAFAWVHFVAPTRSQLSRTTENAQRRMDGFSNALEQIRQALARGGDAAPSTALLLAGTYGLVAPDETEQNEPGLGFSLAESALQIPMLLRVPEEIEVQRAPESLAWAPDVPATICDLAGLSCPDMEGTSLLKPVRDDRTVHALTMVPLEQLGWMPLAAARRGPVKVIRGGRSEDSTVDGSAVDPGVVAELDRFLTEERPAPLPLRLQLADVGPMLEELGVGLDPLPDGGRPHPDAATRRKILNFLWESRRWLVRQPAADNSFPELTSIVMEDELAFSPQLDLGVWEMLVTGQREQGMERLRKIVGAYPTSPDALRWFSVSIYNDDLERALELTRLVMVMRPDEPDLHYDMACMLARLDRVDEAEDSLRSAIEAGFNEWSIIGSDPDLRALRENGALTRISADYRQ